VKVQSCPARDIDPRVLHDILRLRCDVFVVEQTCAYPDIDGRDMEAEAVMLWIDGDDGCVDATARLLVDSDGSYRIGRVCTRQTARRHGLGGALMSRGLELAAAAGASRVMLDAQAQQAGFYAAYGFEPTGREFVEDGIPHVEMLTVLRP
jgi:ElaA protein